jgi:hypothetical protein
MTNFNSFSIRFWMIFLLFLFTFCFEYEEKIYLTPNLDGKITLDYITPINKTTGNSLISFLPSNKKAFEEKYNVKVILFKEEDVKPIIPNFIYKKVHVEYFFKNILEIEDKIYGINSIEKFGNTIIIKRIFKNVHYKKIDHRIYNFFYDFLYQKFKDRLLKFSLSVPKHFDLISNLGNLPLPGELNYQIPIETTFDLNKELIWIITIKINQAP